MRINNILQSYDIYKLYFMSDVYPYFYQLTRSALDHEEGNEFSVVLF